MELEQVGKSLSSNFGTVLGGHYDFGKTVERLLHDALKRLRPRPVPPNWSIRDWRREVEQSAALATARALTDFDPTRCEDLDAFVFQKVAAEVRASHRFEWRFASRVYSTDAGSHPATDGVPPESARVFDQIVEPMDFYGELRDAVGKLPEASRAVIIWHFFSGLTETQIACILHLNQSRVSRLKRAGLVTLKRYLAETGNAA